MTKEKTTQNVQTNNLTEGKMIGEKTQENPLKSKQSKIFICISIIALLLFIALSFYPGGLFNRYNLEDYKKDVKILQKEYKSKNQRLFEEFSQKLKSAGNKNFSLAQSNVDNTVKYFSSSKNCAILLYTIARDKIKKTNESDKLINSIIGPNILKPCYAGAIEINELLAEYAHKIQENNNQFSAECAKKINKLKDKDSRDKAETIFNNNIADFEKEIKAFAVGKTLLAAGTVWEILSIRATYAALIRLLGPLVTKAVSGATAAVLDGPMLIGDIISVIGFAWCAYDIYKFTKILPAQMKNTLQKTITNYQNQVKGRALSIAKEILVKSDNFILEESK